MASWRVIGEYVEPGASAMDDKAQTSLAARNPRVLAPRVVTGTRLAAER